MTATWVIDHGETDVDKITVYVTSDGIHGLSDGDMAAIRQRAAADKLTISDVHSGYFMLEDGRSVTFTRKGWGKCSIS